MVPDMMAPFMGDIGASKGLTNAGDNCVLAPNVSQADGDADAIGDAKGGGCACSTAAGDDGGTLAVLGGLAAVGVVVTRRRRRRP